MPKKKCEHNTNTIPTLTYQFWKHNLLVPFRFVSVFLHGCPGLFSKISKRHSRKNPSLDLLRAWRQLRLGFQVHCFIPCAQQNRPPRTDPPDPWPEGETKCQTLNTRSTKNGRPNYFSAVVTELHLESSSSKTRSNTGIHQDAGVAFSCRWNSSLPIDALYISQLPVSSIYYLLLMECYGTQLSLSPIKFITNTTRMEGRVG